MKILVNSSKRVLRIVDDTQVAANGLTARSITSDEQATINTLWSQNKLVRDDNGLRAETDNETAAQRPLPARLQARFKAESTEVRVALLLMAAAVQTALVARDIDAAKMAINGAANPGIDATVFTTLKSDLLAMFPS